MCHIVVLYMRLVCRCKEGPSARITRVLPILRYCTGWVPALMTGSPNAEMLNVVREIQREVGELLRMIGTW